MNDKEFKGMTYRWTQPYNVQWFPAHLIKELEEVRELIIETVLEHKHFDEANEVIARIRAL